MTVVAGEVVGKWAVACAKNTCDKELREFYSLAKNKCYYKEVQL